jgi:acetyl esterase/lipase
LPAEALLICPWVDLANSGKSIEANASSDYLGLPVLESWSAAYRAGRSASDPLVSPLHANLSGMPPLFVQIGAAEVLRDQIEEFVSRARQAGVEIRASLLAESAHVPHLLAAQLAEGRSAIQELAERVRERVGAPA